LRKNHSFIGLTTPPNANSAARLGALENRPAAAGGLERISTIVAALIDTNILVYRFDPRFPDKQRIATELLRQGIIDDSIRVPHQAILEFVAAVTRPVRGQSILKHPDALREAEEFLNQFRVLYPNEAILRSAVRGCSAYQLNWFDAHLWAYAEYHGLTEMISEDFQHDRLYGTVRAINPFLAAA
jgi:predicted nucleic acid-binding protein